MRIPETIESAMCTTVDSRVDCRRKWSKAPDRFTIPVMAISPTAGSFLRTPSPGSKGPCETVRHPMWSFAPRDASTAIMRL